MGNLFKLILACFLLCILPGFGGNTEFQPYDTFAFSLEPGEMSVYEEDSIFTKEPAKFQYYMASWTRPGLELEVGLLAEDGTEYITTVTEECFQGELLGFPPGDYQVLVRNSEPDSPLFAGKQIIGAIEFDYTGSQKKP